MGLPMEETSTWCSAASYSACWPGAGLPVAFGTSHVALLHRAKLHKGQTALILGAAGGVGTAAVQVGGMSIALSNHLSFA